LRLVIGADALPSLPFAAPDAPAWSLDETIELRRYGDRFSLRHGEHTRISGAAAVTPFRLDIDVGASEIYGFGAATGDSKRNGARFRIMTRDTLFYGIEGASYSAFPFFLVRDDARCFGVLAATTFPLDVVVADGKVSLAGACDTERTPVDVIVFCGSAVEIMQDLAAHVGRSFLPPAWALGYHQSRWSYRTSGAVLDVARRLRALDLPADAIHLDIHYMDRYRVFTFHPRRFPAPERMHEELRTLGLRTLAIVDPGVSTARYPVYEALESGNMLLKRRDGRPYVGKAWPGASVFPDFTEARVRETWGRFHRPLIDAGVAGFWNDMNDPVLRMVESYDPLAEDVQHHDASHRRVRNLYANGMAQATVSGLASMRPNQRHFVLSRSGFLGIQRHAAIWTGDNHSSWRHLRENLDMVVNLGLSGVPISGADVGGFGSGPGKYGAVKLRRPSDELFVRWMELGALMPFFRNHCTLYSRGQEPWSFGPEVLELSRRILRRRYRLLPLLYRLALEAHEDGLPMVRPLFMHYDVPRGEGQGQFLLGDSVLAAPVMREGHAWRDVWLPPGSWTDWNSGVTLAGGSRVPVDAPLGTTPLFVRTGFALFLADPGPNAEETLRAPLALEITPPLAGSVGGGSLFLDDGTSANGPRFLLDVRVEAFGDRMRLQFRKSPGGFVPHQRDFELRLPLGYAGAIVDGTPCELVARELDSEDRSATWLTVRVPIDAREATVALAR
jgi:alpha-glucosidase